MGSGTSVSANDTHHTDGLAISNGLFGYLQEVEGKSYKCCIATGNRYHRSTKVGDYNNEVKRVEFGEVVHPKLKLGHWIKIEDHKWLPVKSFWGPSFDGEILQLMQEVPSSDGKSTVTSLDTFRPAPLNYEQQQHKQKRPSKRLSVGSGGYSRSWDFLDAMVKQVMVNDVIDSVTMRCDKILATSRQRAERGKQDRKRRKAKRKARRQSALRQKTAEVYKLRLQLHNVTSGVMRDMIKRSFSPSSSTRTRDKDAIRATRVSRSPTNYDNLIVNTGSQKMLTTCSQPGSSPTSPAMARAISRSPRRRNSKRASPKRNSKCKQPWNAEKNKNTKESYRTVKEVNENYEKLSPKAYTGKRKLTPKNIKGRKSALSPISGVRPIHSFEKSDL